MKLKEIIDGSGALKRLSDNKLTDYKKLRNIMLLRKRFDEEISFYIKEESNIIKEYAKTNKDGSLTLLENGRIELKDKEAKIAFEKEIEKLKNIEIENLVSISLSEKDFKDEYPSPNDMLLLENIIEFTE